MSKLIVVVSGKKGSGKNTIANEIAAAIMNIRQFGDNSHRWPDKDKLHKAYMTGKFVAYTGEALEGVRPEIWEVSKKHDGILMKGTGVGSMYSCSLEERIGSEDDIQKMGVRIIGFATLLKNFCMTVLGLSQRACYGSDSEKNMLTHIKWDNFPLRVRLKNRKAWWYRPRSGFMSGREVLQVIGTDVVRKIFPDAWASAAYIYAASCKEDVVIICDGRFPNEIEMSNLAANSSAVVVRKIRTLRAPHSDNHISETALDNYPLSRFNKVLPATTTFEEQHDIVMQTVKHWLITAGLSMRIPKP